MVEQKPRYDLAIEHAEALASKYDSPDSGIIPVQKIAQDHGILIKEVDFNDEWFDDVSGLYLFDKKAILVNKNDSNVRKRFTIAHELGHAVLHSKENYKVLLRSDTYNGDERYEKEANCFAAALLVPAEKCKKFIHTYNLREDEHLNIIAGYFGVSKSMMKFRLLNLAQHG